MQVIKNKAVYHSLISLLALLLLFVLFECLGTSAVLAAPSSSLEICGDGVKNPTTFTRAQLEEMPQYQQVYSSINTWPSKKWYVGKGIHLSELLSLVGIKDDARLLKFISQDGYTMTLTVKELLEDKRYYFPYFNDNQNHDGEGNIVGSSQGAELVEPIIALISVEGSNNPNYMSDLNTLVLMMGQRAVTEQTGNAFVKYLNKIEVLTSEVPKWDSPQANPGSGEVSAGTMIALSTARMDDDKIYYTTDGSTPNLNSPIYNWIAKRWWSARADILGTYNHPIGPINENTTIKAITIGPGKENSDVATFTYTVPVSKPASETSIVAPNEETNYPDQALEKPLQSEPKATLTDVQNHWAQKNINELIASGIAGGYPDGSFRPDNTITRAEFATMLVKAFNLQKQGGKVFADSEQHWAKEYISRATASGVVSGYDAENFGPDKLITREQMAVMISKAAKVLLKAEAMHFADSASISEWAKEAVLAANQSGIMKGYPDNTIRPQGSASRAEAVTVIVNALTLK